MRTFLFRLNSNCSVVTLFLYTFKEQKFIYQLSNRIYGFGNYSIKTFTRELTKYADKPLISTYSTSSIILNSGGGRNTEKTLMF